MKRVSAHTIGPASAAWMAALFERAHSREMLRVLDLPSVSVFPTLRVAVPTAIENDCTHSYRCSSRRSAYSMRPAPIRSIS
jgi:hypothetical protein